MGAVAGGALLGGIGGAMAGQKEGGKTAGNMFLSGHQGLDPGHLQGLIADSMGEKTQFLRNIDDIGTGLQQDPVLGQLFGQGGTLSRANQEEQQLASRGFSLKPEDYEAYGQASGDVARMFGQQEQSLAQSLADRGLSNSNIAGAEFTGLQGNKQERLAGLQRQIANDRMKMNMERLGQTRNFLSQMGNQAGNALQDRYGRVKDAFGVRNSAGDQAMNYLGAMQGQANKNLEQEADTQHSSRLSDAFSGAVGGGMAGARMMGGMAGGGPMAGAQTAAPMAGGSYLKGGMFA